MRVVTSSITGSGTIGPIVVDYIQSPFNGGVYVTVSGTATYTVLVSPDDPQSTWTSGYGTSAGWFNYNASTNLVTASTTQYNLVSTPCQGIKVTVSATSTSVVKAQWLQGIAGAN